MDSALKQRLLGAAVLIALAIIFVPMFFSGTPPKADGTTTQNLSIPPAPERNFETRNLSVDPPKPGAAPTPAPSAPPATAATSGDKLATVDTGAPASFEAPDSATRPAPAAKPTTASANAQTLPATPAPATPTPVPPPAPAVATDGRFLVNLGVYADAGHASALVDKLKKLGYPAFAETTDYQGKPAQRVRVGPYAERASAENVRLKIKQIDAKLPSGIAQTADPDQPTDKPADKAGAGEAKPAAAKSAAAEPAAPAPSLPANRAGAYVVQAGAFKSEDEANKLRDRLRNGGVAAFVEKSGDGETTFWKVRAGPYADRGGADAAVSTLKQKFQLAAIVKTQP